MLRVWFNRTYATNRQVIAQLRANPEGRELHVVGTHTDPDSPVLSACDESAAEPDLDAAGYVEWALRFAQARHIDVLVPRAHQVELAEARDQFAAIGTRLLCADAGTLRLFADKAAAYEAATTVGVPVPPHRVVTDAAGLCAAYEQFATIAEWVCLKPCRGSGGAGYRRLSTAPPSMAEFAGKPGSVVRLQHVCAALDADAAAGRPVAPLLVMPYLTGPEVSVDVVASAAGEVLAAVGRTRSLRRRLLVDDVPARRIAEALTAAHRIAYLSNTQVRYWKGPSDPSPRAYLLEVNTRISGGLFQTALAGVNLPWTALRLALGERVEPLHPKFGAAFTTLAELVPLP
jgi:biotin carboxylase